MHSRPYAHIGMRSQEGLDPTWDGVLIEPAVSYGSCCLRRGGIRVWRADLQRNESGRSSAVLFVTAGKVCASVLSGKWHLRECARAHYFVWTV